MKQCSGLAYKDTCWRTGLHTKKLVSLRTPSRTLTAQSNSVHICIELTDKQPLQSVGIAQCWLLHSPCKHWCNPAEFSLLIASGSKLLAGLEFFFFCFHELFEIRSFLCWVVTTFWNILNLYWLVEQHKWFRNGSKKHNTQFWRLIFLDPWRHDQFLHPWDVLDKQVLHVNAISHNLQVFKNLDVCLQVPHVACGFPCKITVRYASLSLNLREAPALWSLFKSPPTSTVNTVPSIRC